MKYTILLFTFLFSFSLFAADKTKTVSLNISGMTCQSCVSTVEKALKSVEGVKVVKVDLKKNKATVTLASLTTTSASLIKAVSDAGFDASEGPSVSKTEIKIQSKSEKEDCGDGCCGDESGAKTKMKKSKKIDVKKS